MRFMIMHKTTAAWEAGATPGRELIARVGALMGELDEAGVLRDGAGLRASSQGVRLTFARGARTLVKGPLPGGNELPAGFSIVRTETLEQAVAWASKLAAILGDVEIDVRPVTEPWDIGVGEKPAGLNTRRFMALVKATAASEAEGLLTSEQRAALGRLLGESTRSGMHETSEVMRPSASGRRFTHARVVDGPFVESKELLAGYVTVEVRSLDEASELARRYLAVVGTAEVDVRELEAPPAPRAWRSGRAAL